MNLKQFSAALGLSPTTVSRALNGHADVRVETRERVQAAALRLGYRANARARGLATGRAKTVAHILPLRDDEELVSPIFGEFVAGAGEVYARRGYDMNVSVVAPDDEERAYRDIAARGVADGFVLHGLRMRDARIGLLRELGLPFAVYGCRDEGEEGYAFFDVDNRDAFRRAADFLLDLGHRRIALLNGLEAYGFAHLRRQGYDAALAARGVARDERLARAAAMTERFGYAAAAELLRENDPPTAFLTASLIVAMGARRAAIEHGCVIGEDVAICTHDDELAYLPNAGEPPIFTATRWPARESGRRCASALLDQIERPGEAPARALWKASIVLGASTGRAR